MELGCLAAGGGRRAANVQMGVVLCGERRTWSWERRTWRLCGVQPRRRGAFGIASVAAAGGFSFRVFCFLFFPLFSILYRATVPVSFFCELKKTHRIIDISLWVFIVFLCVLSRTGK